MSESATQTAIKQEAEHRTGRFFYLFLAQVLMLVLWPYLETGWALMIYRLLGMSTLIAAIFALSVYRASWIVSLVLGVPALLLNSIVMVRYDPRAAVAAILCSLAFLAFVVASLLRAVLAARLVTSDTIFGAISVYMLMALTWAVGYFLLVTLQPGALVDVRRASHQMEWSDCLFYSYVTLTSLGYGDILPGTSHARSLSVMEAVSGIMYVAVLVARLVGLYSGSRSQG